MPSLFGRNAKLFCSILLGCTLWQPVAAASLSLQQQQLPAGIQFSYQRGQQPWLSFVLDPASLPAQTGGARRYSPAQAQAFIRQQLLLQAVKLAQQGVRLQLSPPAQPLSFQLSGPPDQLSPDQLSEIQRQLQQLQQQAYQQYLQQGQFYRLTNPLGSSFIIPDHVAVLKQQLPLLKPVANAFIALYGQNNIRKIASQVALWIQQIPYVDLSDRSQSAGAGFVSPWQLLQQHRGDCDSKAVLFAGVMRHIAPTMKLAILYFPDHAVIAAQIPAIKDELTVTIEGKPLLIIDATGPAENAIGTLAKPYLFYLYNRQFNYRLF